MSDPLACRNSACGAVLHPAWAFCATCGTQTSALVGATDVRFLLPTPFEGEHEIVVAAQGARPVQARIEWLELPAGVDPLPLRASPEGCSLRFRLREDLALSRTTPLTLHAVLITDDGVRGARWHLRQERRQGLRIHLCPETEGRLTTVQELLVLDWDSPPRELHLRNEGGRPVRLRAVEAPEGVTVSDIRGRPLDAATLPEWSVGAGKSALLGVRLAGSAACVGEATLRLVPTEGPSVTVRLLLPRETRGGFMPRYVVGIDVGTENVSVYGRDLTDDSVFPVPLEPGTTRMPCYVAFDDPASQEPVAYGKSAVDRLVLGRGVVTRDLKVHLRHGGQSYARRFGDVFRVENLLYFLLAHVKERVEQALEARAGAITGVRWCVTLPVLVEPTAFESLRRKYAAVLRRVFQREIKDGRLDPDTAFGFLTEPESAALYVFQRLGHDAPDLLKRPFQDGDVVCVVDAGAGTTDLALMRMRIVQGTQTFEILGEAGTDLPAAEALHSEDFGGRSADLAVIECLARSSLRGGHATPENVARQIGMLLGQGVPDGDKVRNRALQAAMEAKQQLCVPNEPARRIDVRETAWPELDRTVPGEITLRRFHVTVQPALDRILHRLDELINRCGLARRDVGWVFAIGGSSNIPLVEERLQALFPGRVISLEGHRSVRMEAVARGAVWSWRARLRNVAPLDVVVQVRQGERVQRQPLLFADRPLSMRPQEYQFELVEEAEVELMGMVEGQALRLTGLRVEAAGAPRPLSIRVSAEGGALRLEASIDGAARLAPMAWLA